MLIPVSEAVKTKMDIAAGGTSVVAVFKMVPWPELAGALACLYWLVRIIERGLDRWRKK